MDDECLSCGNRNPLPQASQARPRYRRKTGNLSRLSGFQGMHLAVCPDLDQRNGASARLNSLTITDNSRDNNVAADAATHRHWTGVLGGCRKHRIALLLAQ